MRSLVAISPLKYVRLHFHQLHSGLNLSDSKFNTITIMSLALAHFHNIIASFAKCKNVVQLVLVTFIQKHMGDVQPLQLLTYGASAQTAAQHMAGRAGHRVLCAVNTRTQVVVSSTHARRDSISAFIFICEVYIQVTAHDS